jgi:lipopolysaccharide export system protein LptC
MSTRPWRMRFLLIVVPLVMLALGSFWLYEVMRRAATDTPPDPNRSGPDFFVENFSFIKMSTSGTAQYHVAGTKLTHNPQDDSYDVALPVVSNFGNPQTPMTMRAERGRISNDNSQVDLYDNVRVDRPASPTTQAMRVRSDYLRVLPDDDVVKTDRPVEIIVGQSKLTGTGMWANNATRELNLTSNVHGTYQAPPR